MKWNHQKKVIIIWQWNASFLHFNIYICTSMNWWYLHLYTKTELHLYIHELMISTFLHKDWTIAIHDEEWYLHLWSWKKLTTLIHMFMYILKKNYFNHWFLSTLLQVIACCLMALIHVVLIYSKHFGENWHVYDGTTWYWLCWFRLFMFMYSLTQCGLVMQYGVIKIWSTLVQVRAVCLAAPSHYLNQCWLIISEVFWHLRAISQEMSHTNRDLGQHWIR